MGLLDAYTGNRKALKAQVLIQNTVCWEHIRFIIGQTLIVPAPLIGGAEKANLAVGGNQDEVFERVTFFLAAVVEGLFVRVTRSVDRPFGAVVEKRDPASGMDCGAVPAGVSDRVAVRSGTYPPSAKA